jgi:hypothetical protein
VYAIIKPLEPWLILATIDKPTFRRSYIEPELQTLDVQVFEGPWTEVLPDDFAAVDKLRPLYLLNREPDVLPIATRITVSIDRQPREWQKVLALPASPALQEGEGVWYLLSHVPHSIAFAIELQVRSPDAKVRIAHKERIKLLADRKLGLFVLQRGQEEAHRFSNLRQTAVQ